MLKLGIFLDSKLNWHKHIAHIKSKIAKGLGIMCRVRDYISCNTMLTLYNTLIYPYLVYCNIIWGTANKTVLDKLFLLQKRAIRICAGASFRSPTSPLFVCLKKLKLHDINKLQTLLFVFKFKNNMLPNCCMHYAVISDVERTHNTRNVPYLKKLRCATDIRKKSISVHGPSLWN